MAAETEVAAIEPGEGRALLEVEAAVAARLASKAQSANTRRAYAADCADYQRWCAARGLTPYPAPPAQVGVYLASLSDRCRPATLARRLSALVGRHRELGLELETRAAPIRLVIQGARRTHGTMPRRKAPLLTADVAAMVATAPASLRGLRDRALLLLGFALGARRSELVALDVEDLAVVAEGLVVTIRRGKSDQVGEGRRVGVPAGGSVETCPVRAVTTWLAAAELESGAVFRPIAKTGEILYEPRPLTPAVPNGTGPRRRGGRLSDRMVAKILQTFAARIGRDSAAIGGHSLRAGHATQAAIGGASERKLQDQTGHRSAEMLRRYIRDGDLFRENSAGKLGL